MINEWAILLSGAVIGLVYGPTWKVDESGMSSSTKDNEGLDEAIDEALQSFCGACGALKERDLGRVCPHCGAIQED
ncbi:hypothetical protein BXT84_05355 [Sulfobacillus thermotolerans]|uniref:Uncharacterized protein n=1 Tax=Sulfobacillus thermotolerans TaxID=338644 RepID=A0ABM6RQ47_9FIRM|nr:hypothetical protein BXT84_05355 [Sulfobacillus thermotolerans]